MRLRPWLCAALLAIVPTLASAAPTVREAAVLAGLPDGTSTTVRLVGPGDAASRSLHAVRRGTRLTLFDRSDRQYRTFVLARTGSVLVVFDRLERARHRFVVRGGASVVSLLALPAARSSEEEPRRQPARNPGGDTRRIRNPRVEPLPPRGEYERVMVRGIADAGGFRSGRSIASRAVTASPRQRASGQPAAVSRLGRSLGVPAAVVYSILAEP